MKHFGDITKIDGTTVPLVDIITGGSPCQDLSIAGRREGLDGERSGLFMEQIRIIKEMRNESRRQANGYIRPRFMVWENVPGVFSSNGGEDFRVVLEETARVADSSAVIPRLPSGEVWSSSGCILGDRWSIAWRVHDLQFWGCPQRRARVSLVGDFGGQSAPKILFEQKKLSWDIEESGREGEGTPRASSEDSYKTISFLERFGKDGGVKESSSLPNESEHCQPSTSIPSSTMVYGISPKESNAMRSGNPHSGIYEAETARTLDLQGGNPNCNQGGMMVVQKESKAFSQDAYDKYSPNSVSATIKESGGIYGGGSECLVITTSGGGE